MKHLFAIFFGVVAFSCSKTSSTGDLPECVQSAIDSALASPKGSIYTKIDAYTYNGTTVYLCYAGCCDRYNDVRDGGCNYLFSPSGGITGGGDHTHPNFFKDAHLIKTVWIDPRP